MPRLKVLAVLAAVAALAAPAAKANDETNQDHRRVTVMTQNLYLGADLNPIFAAPTPLALFAAVGAAWNSVQANDFPSRAQAVADEIAAARPDLVGLQEATLYRTDVPPDGPATPAETVAYDYVQVLVDALAERGLSYEPVSVFTGTDAELPAGLPPQLDVRITDRVVVLARASGGPTVHVSNPQSGRYATALTVPTAAGPITLPRGWASVDVKVRGDRFRFVSTHLEAFSPLIRNPQAAQLVSGPLATDQPVVVVGDFNSGPGADPGAYGILTGGGLADAWPGGPFTCCHASDLHLAGPALSKRIDLVLTRGGFSTTAADVVGEEPGDRTPSGLWPSDHAGVVTTLQLP
jgi:endonuclease/exonuclease/phosphatase family metal-dependent hydrolase